MSLFGAMSTAISGINAQSGAFSNISDNVANSQTVGFKRVDTSFLDYLTNSTAEVNDSGSVSARPDYVNDVQGTVTQTQNALEPRDHRPGLLRGQPAERHCQRLAHVQRAAILHAHGRFQPRQERLSREQRGQRAGRVGRRSDGAVQRNALAPIQVAKSIFSPVATTQVTMAANLPATPASTSTTSSQVAIYDALGNKHAVTLNWTQNATNDWTVAVNVPDDTTAAARGTADVKFGSASGNAVPDGTIGSIGGATGSVTGSAYAAGSASSVSFTTNFGSGPQTVQINLGTYGQSTGMTQFAGTDYNLRSLTQNGVASRQLQRRDHPGERRRRRELRQRSVAHDRARSGRDVRGRGQAAAAERPGFHGRHRFGNPAHRRFRRQRSGQPGREFRREFQRRYRERVQQADRRAARLLGQHQGGDDRRRPAAADNRHEALTAADTTMSLDGALSIATSGLANIDRHFAVISQNVANASTPGYTREIATQESVTASGIGMGVRTNATARQVDDVLQGDLLAAERDGWRPHDEEAVRCPRSTRRSDRSAAARICRACSGNLQDAFSTLADRSLQPDAAGGGGRQARKICASGINRLADTYTAQRQAAQDGIVSDVATLNTTLGTIGALTRQIVALKSAGQSTADLENQRDAAVQTISSVDRREGVAAGQRQRDPRDVERPDARRPTAPARTAPSRRRRRRSGRTRRIPRAFPAITLGGVDVTRQIGGGTLGARIALRDTTLPTDQAELDEFSQNLASRFDAQGLRLFTDASGAVPASGGTPAQAGYVGFSSSIQVNAAVAATPALVRDGTQAVAGSATGATAFTPNPRRRPGRVLDHDRTCSQLRARAGGAGGRGPAGLPRRPVSARPAA